MRKSRFTEEQMVKSRPNQVWAYDFVFDHCANGQRLKCLTVVDEWTREALAIDVAGSIRSGRVIEVLARLVSLHGAPRYLRSDNGPEFVTTAVLRWLTEEGTETAHVAPGKPWQKGTDESFNGRFRDECLSMEWFRNRIEAAVVIERWRRHYNRVRPHSSLDYLTPLQFKSQHQRPGSLDRISRPYVNPVSSPLHGAIALDALASRRNGPGRQGERRGDENDAACFGAFRTTFGVANLRGRPTLRPRFVTRGARGAGFAELARTLGALRASAE